MKNVIVRAIEIGDDCARCADVQGCDKNKPGQKGLCLAAFVGNIEIKLPDRYVHRQIERYFPSMSPVTGKKLEPILLLDQIEPVEALQRSIREDILMAANEAGVIEMKGGKKRKIDTELGLARIIEHGFTPPKDIVEGRDPSRKKINLIDEEQLDRKDTSKAPSDEVQGLRHRR